MPTSLINSIAKKSNKSKSEIEALWTQAKDIAGKKLSKASSEFYAYAVGILKKMAKVKKEAYDDLNTPHRIRQEPKNSASKIFKRDEFLRDRKKKDKEADAKENSGLSDIDLKMMQIESTLHVETEFKVDGKELKYKFSGQWVGGPKAQMLFRKEYKIPAQLNAQQILVIANKLLNK